MFSWESPYRGDSNEYAQHSIINRKKSLLIIPNIIMYVAMGFFFLWTQERVRDSHGRATEHYCTRIEGWSVIESRNGSFCRNGMLADHNKFKNPSVLFYWETGWKSWVSRKISIRYKKKKNKKNTVDTFDRNSLYKKDRKQTCIFLGSKTSQTHINVYHIVTIIL